MGVQERWLREGIANVHYYLRPQGASPESTGAAGVSRGRQASLERGQMKPEGWCGWRATVHRSHTFFPPPPQSLANTYITRPMAWHSALLTSRQLPEGLQQARGPNGSPTCPLLSPCPRLYLHPWHHRLLDLPPSHPHRLQAKHSHPRASTALCCLTGEPLPATAEATPPAPCAASVAAETRRRKPCTPAYPW